MRGTTNSVGRHQGEIELFVTVLSHDRVQLASFRAPVPGAVVVSRSSVCCLVSVSTSCMCCRHRFSSTGRALTSVPTRTCTRPQIHRAHTHTRGPAPGARPRAPARPDLDKCTSTHTAHRGFSKTPRPLTQAQANHAHGLGKVAPSGDRVHRAPRPYGESDDPALERSAPRSRRRPCPSECTRRTCP